MHLVFNILMCFSPRSARIYLYRIDYIYLVFKIHMHLVFNILMCFSPRSARIYLYRIELYIFSI